MAKNYWREYVKCLLSVVSIIKEFTSILMNSLLHQFSITKWYHMTSTVTNQITFDQWDSNMFSWCQALVCKLETLVAITFTNWNGKDETSSKNHFFKKCLKYVWYFLKGFLLIFDGFRNFLPKTNETFLKSDFSRILSNENFNPISVNVCFRFCSSARLPGRHGDILSDNQPIRRWESTAWRVVINESWKQGNFAPAKSHKKRKTGTL